MHHALLVRGSPDVVFRARTHARTPCIARTIDLLLCTLSGTVNGRPPTHCRLSKPSQEAKPASSSPCSPS
ncbi:hypothetical protein B296_00025093 [Ensete ventricosum]|uniref:Uncharacterized protein n=1 Tax=Ensete ventricosum TaxID=4639 RepID=A0A426YM34_ENSVE|nr:hypothetical protein B296_00025093 [Ensete ventricosum]